jgi:predicted enzyme related to lactoylglutathione lyase
LIATSDVIAFVSTTDLPRARAFYEAVLGLPVVDENPYACVCNAHGTMLRITAVAEVAHPGYTVLGWRVTDIGETVADLESRGSSSLATTAWSRTPTACGPLRTAIASPGSPTPTGTFCLSPSSTDPLPSRTAPSAVELVETTASRLRARGCGG